MAPEHGLHIVEDAMSKMQKVLKLTEKHRKKNEKIKNPVRIETSRANEKPFDRKIRLRA